jgi:hypothetical protein
MDRLMLRLLVLLWFATSPALAYDIPPPPPAPYQGLVFPLFPNSKTIPFGVNAAGKRAAPRAVSTVASGSPQTASNARQLAMAVPPERREQMARVYVESFDTWRRLERKLGLPPDDVAGAIAAFIAGNYMAYRNVEVPDETYHRLVEQMRGALTGSRAFATASASDKRRLYEQMAMVGTFMALARMSFQRQPNPQAEQNFRDSAAANLEAALKVPADQVRITDEGLTLQ